MIEKLDLAPAWRGPLGGEPDSRSHKRGLLSDGHIRRSAA
jgi:hypothetical protein